MDLIDDLDTDLALAILVEERRNAVAASRVAEIVREVQAALIRVRACSTSKIPSSNPESGRALTAGPNSR